MNIIEFHARLTKNNENLRIQFENNENHKHLKTPCYNK